MKIYKNTQWDIQITHPGLEVFDSNQIDIGNSYRENQYLLVDLDMLEFYRS